jgi:ferredoxin--NADP+ reductase
VQLDALSQKSVEESGDKSLPKKIQILQSFVDRASTGKPRTLTLRFLVSPLELYDDGSGGVKGMKIVRNELYVSDDGSLRPRPTEHFEEIDVDMVFRSVGYRGVPLAGLPFHDRWSVVPNEGGRVVDLDTDEPLKGVYVAGWIKRGPSGIIGTNKPDAGETVDRMMEDLAAGALLLPGNADPDSVDQLVRNAQPGCLSWEDWKRIQEIEEANGDEQGRPRVKLTAVQEMLAALGR